MGPAVEAEPRACRGRGVPPGEGRTEPNCSVPFNAAVGRKERVQSPWPDLGTELFSAWKEVATLAEQFSAQTTIAPGRPRHQRLSSQAGVQCRRRRPAPKRRAHDPLTLQHRGALVAHAHRRASPCRRHLSGRPPLGAAGRRRHWQDQRARVAGRDQWTPRPLSGLQQGHCRRRHQPVPALRAVQDGSRHGLRSCRPPVRSSAQQPAPARLADRARPGRRITRPHR